MSSDAYRKVGRGGAGNFISKEERGAEVSATVRHGEHKQQLRLVRTLKLNLSDHQQPPKMR